MHTGEDHDCPGPMVSFGCSFSKGIVECDAKSKSMAKIGSPKGNRFHLRFFFAVETV